MLSRVSWQSLTRKQRAVQYTTKVLTMDGQKKYFDPTFIDKLITLALDAVHNVYFLDDLNAGGRHATTIHDAITLQIQ